MEKCLSALEETLDEENWKDSFDRLLNKRSLLRDLNVLKTNVRLSFNNDSSVEASKCNISNHINSNEIKIDYNDKSKASGTISTPILTNKLNGPFDCALSPISSWRLTHFSQRDVWESSCNDKSRTLEKVSKSKAQKKSFLDRIPKLTINGSEDQCLGSNKITKLNCSISEVIDEINNANVVLPPGKWRRSLTVWKKLNRIKNTDDLPQNDFVRCSHNNFSFLKQRLTSRKSDINSQEELLKVCMQREIMLFSDLYSDTALRKCRKIGEGTYGEVFLNSSENEEIVLKIIPIEGDMHFNGECQKRFDQILPEVIITSELSNLRQSESYTTSGFVFLKNVRCLRGKYPEHLIDLWNLYEQNYGSENDHPEMFKNDQLYVAFEIAYGGKDLEKFVFRNSEQAYAAFLQVTMSLAAAEGHLQFEHRDLHCGNILIQPTVDKKADFTVNNKRIQISTSGVKVTIIDYTLSRMLLKNCCYYNDLSMDEELFCAEGDYQYDIYRSMRKKLGNNWRKFDPQTNVMWLHYILTKLIYEAKYKNTTSKQHKLFMDRMKLIQKTVLQYESASKFSNKMCD